LRALARLHFVQPHNSAFSFGNDFLRHHHHIIVDQFNPLARAVVADQRADRVAAVNLSDPFKAK